MEKIYTKNGFSFINDSGKTIEISRAMVVKSIADQEKLLENIQRNLINLNADLSAINNA